jgi:hypothetical protein
VSRLYTIQLVANRFGLGGDYIVTESLVHKRLVATDVIVLGTPHTSGHGTLQLYNQFTFDLVTWFYWTWKTPPLQGRVGTTQLELPSGLLKSTQAFAHWRGRQHLPRRGLDQPFLRVVVTTAPVTIVITGWALTAPTTP